MVSTKTEDEYITKTEDGQHKITEDGQQNKQKIVSTKTEDGCNL